MDIKKEFQKIINQDYENIDSEFVKELEKIFGFTSKREEFITVVDGWRGSLKLKECWVTNNVNNGYIVLENVELLARDDLATLPFKGLVNHTVLGYKHLKFRPFSPENPPPVDWPVKISTGGNEHSRHFRSFTGEAVINFFSYGKTSFTCGAYTSYDMPLDNFEFLNIETVED